MLSALLLDARSFHEVTAEVRAEDFYHPAHQELFSAMVRLHDQRKPVDLITLSEHLDREGTLEAVGGPVVLAEIADFEATAANVVHHASIVRDKAVRRRLIAVATDIVETGFSGTHDAGQLLDFAESRIFEVSTAQSRTSFSNLHDEMPATFDYIDGIMARQGDLTGIPTGYDELDKMTGGLQGGELIIIAARPGMGKTALALNVVRNMCVDHGKKAAVFSLEMTTRSLILRLLASEAKVDFKGLRTGFLPKREYEKLQGAADRLSRAGIWIDDSGSATILEIKAKCRRLHAEGGLDLVVVDYLQLASVDGKRDRKDLEIAEISKGLKALSKELDIPVIALSQLNRGPEQRDPDKRRPMLGDLRESGAIEQDADLIAFIYRDSVYNKETEHPNKAELLIEKQRNGPTGKVELYFDGRYARFANWSNEDESAGFNPGGGAGFVPPDDDGSLPPLPSSFDEPFDGEPPF